MQKNKNNPNRKWFDKFCAFTDEFEKGQLKLNGEKESFIGKKSGEQDEVCFVAIYTEDGEDAELRVAGQSSDSTRFMLLNSLIKQMFNRN